MNKVLIQPCLGNFSEYSDLAAEHNMSYEITNFAAPDILEDDEKCSEIIDFYKEKLQTIKYLSMHGVFLDIYLFSPDIRIREISRDRILHNCRIAQKLGVNSIVFHTNYIPMLKSDSYINNWINENAEFWSDIIQKHRLKIYMENMFDFIPDVLKKLITKVNSPNFKACLDTGHCNISKASMKEWFDVLDEDIAYMHLNDNNGNGDEHLPVGKGNIDWHSFNELVNSSKIKPVTVLELFNTADIRASITYLKDNRIYPFNE